MSRDRSRPHGARGNAKKAEDEENEEDDHYLVSCRCESAKILSTLLSCLDNISGSSSSSAEETKARKKASSSTLQPVTVYVTAKSISFHVYGKAKQIQSSVDMQASMFMEYHVSSSSSSNHVDDNNNNGDGATPEDWQAGGEFCVNLSTLLECLHMLGTHHMERTKVSFSYNTTKEIFKLEMIDEFSTFFVAAIPGMMCDNNDDDHGNALPLAFRSSPVTARIIVQSGTLHAVMSELDLVTSATRATVSISRTTGLRFSVVGSMGNCTIIVPLTGHHVVSVELPSMNHDNDDTPTSNDYPLQVLKDSMRGLDIAEETCITMNRAGMVAIQHIVFDKTLSEEPCFVDCILCSLCNEHSDDEEEEEATTAPYAVPSPQSVAVSTGWLESRSNNIGTTKKSKVTQPEDDEEEGKDDDHEEQQSTLLFGSVVGDSNASRASSSNRNVRRRTRRRNNVDGNDSDGSRNMLLDHNDKEDSSDAADDDSDCEMETATSRTQVADKRIGTTATRHENCPSPELLYGHQH